MQMKPEHVCRLSLLIERPHLSLRSQLILVRRMARHLNTERELTSSYFKAEVRKAEAELPFTKRRLAKIKGAQGKSLEAFESGLIDIGAWLYKNDEALTAHYGFEGICDLLEVNPVHRAEVIKYAKDMTRAIAAAAFDSGLEDSANGQSGRQTADWKEGPLYQAIWEAGIKDRAKWPG